MKIEFVKARQDLQQALSRKAFPNPAFAAYAAVWLEAFSYPGLKKLVEALSDVPKVYTLKRDQGNIDLEDVSCAIIGEAVVQDVLQHGKAYLRQVRHGLFLVPASVDHAIAIGCPIDAGFSLGGPRASNPYGDKLQAAQRDGLEIDDALWQQLTE